MFYCCEDYNVDLSTNILTEQYDEFHEAQIDGKKYYSKKKRPMI